MKRFTETDKWKDAWFMDLPSKWKLAWLWIIDNCDHAGICDANPRLMSAMIGEPIDGAELLRVMQGRVECPKPGKWFVTKFIVFQYGEELNPQNSAHKGVINKLRAVGIQCPVKLLDSPCKAPTKGLPSPCQGAQDKDKDKDKDSGKARARNPVIDVLACIDGSQLDEITGPAWAAAGKALSQIKAVTPDVTPDEIRRRSANYRTKYRDATISPLALAKHWAALNSGSDRPKEKIAVWGEDYK